MSEQAGERSSEQSSDPETVLPLDPKYEVKGNSNDSEVVVAQRPEGKIPAAQGHADLERFFEPYSEKFRDTYVFRENRKYFKDKVAAQSNLTINHCLCLGIGPLAGHEDSVDYMSQFVAYIEWIKVLREDHNIPLDNVYLRPAGDYLDEITKDFIRSKGVQVLHPTESSDITPTTFLFTPISDDHDIWASLLEMFEGNPPSLYIGPLLQDGDAGMTVFESFSGNDYSKHKRALQKMLADLHRVRGEVGSLYFLPGYEMDHINKDAKTPSTEHD